MKLLCCYVVEFLTICDTVTASMVTSWTHLLLLNKAARRNYSWSLESLECVFLWDRRRGKKPYFHEFKIYFVFSIGSDLFILATWLFFFSVRIRVRRCSHVFQVWIQRFFNKFERRKLHVWDPIHDSCTGLLCLVHNVFCRNRARRRSPCLLECWWLCFVMTALAPITNLQRAEFWTIWCETSSTWDWSRQVFLPRSDSETEDVMGKACQDEEAFFFWFQLLNAKPGVFCKFFFFGATCFTSQFMPMSEQKRRMPKSCTMTRPAAKADMLWNSLFDSMIESRKQPVLSLCNCVF